MTESVWSPSRVLCYRSCPRQEALRYRKGDPATSWPDMINVMAEGKPSEMWEASATKLRLGTITHAGLEAAYRMAARMTRELERGRLMSTFADTAMGAISEAWDRLNMPTEGVEGFELMASIESEVFDVLARLPVPRPDAVLGVEHEVVVPTPGGRMMRGVLDLALQVGYDALHIRDWKRRPLKALPRSVELPRDDALAFYRYAARFYWPHLPRVSVGLYSTLSNREVIADAPFQVAESVVLGHDLLAESADADRERKPTPDGSNCTYCPVRNDCPTWTPLRRGTAETT